MDGGAGDGCSPITNDTSKIGATCVNTNDCPVGYTCWAMSGIVVQYQCQILCGLDCHCPSGLTCQQFSDKGGSWMQCAP